MAMLKKYEELREDIKEDARELHPNDYANWLYRTQGVEIYYSTKGGTFCFTDVNRRMDGDAK